MSDIYNIYRQAFENKKKTAAKGNSEPKEEIFDDNGLFTAMIICAFFPTAVRVSF